MPSPRPSMEQRAARRRRTMVERLVHSHEEVEEFNREFWRSVGHEVRFAAAWDMVLDVSRMRGKRARQPRLRRSVTKLEHRES